ncbi:hypothetical protein ACWDPV_07200 [Gordonia sp. NPDC003504]|jgi:hypothetical protein
MIDTMGTTHTLTDLLRHPNEVTAEAEHGAVRITRRDAADLVLMRAGDLESREAGIALASRLMRATHAHGHVIDALRAADAWFGQLDDDEQRECAAEIDSLLWSAVELGIYQRLLDEYDAWRGTAAAYAAGFTPGDGTEITTSPVPAEQP